MRTIGSLFSGIGGLELGLERAGVGETIWQVEKEEFRRGILAKRWPRAKRFDDVRAVGARLLNKVYALCGGFPCQDVSQAARGRNSGLDGERSGLWYEYLRIVDELRPQWVVVENVASGKARWLPEVRRGLFVHGYDSTAIELGAVDVGANHTRKRVFVVAYPYKDGKSTFTVDAEAYFVSPNAATMWNGWKAEPDSFRMDDGLPAGLDRVEALGDSVVPQCAEVIGRLIVANIERNS